MGAMRTRVKNALQGLALAHGLPAGGLVESRGPGDAGRLAAGAAHAADRRAELQALHDHLTAHITELDQQVGRKRRSGHRRAA